MSLSLYTDVHVRQEIVDGLRRRGVDVVTAREDGAARWPDDALVTRAGQLERVLVSQDEHMLGHATTRQRRGAHFGGVIYGHQLRVTIGGCIDDLELVAKVYEPADMADRVLYLPL